LLPIVRGKVKASVEHRAKFDLGISTETVKVVIELSKYNAAETSPKALYLI